MPELWESVLHKIRSKISDFHYNYWFQGVRCSASEEGVLKLSVPNVFTRDWLREYYESTIVEEARRIGGAPWQLEIEIRPEAAAESDAVDLPAERPVSHQLADAAARRPLVTSVVAAPLGDPLNPKYDFDRFVIGTNNQFATAACKAVADLPGGHYNPLFIYGGVGLGKTHLLNAIGLQIQERFPHLRILYVSSERFMNEVINAIRFDKTAELRKKYRDGCDVLLMDDIQFIAGKERTQDEFFHTFNVLYYAQKQIVVTSDRFPKDVDGLDDRLRSRFEWGLIADIQAPDLETRIAILQKKAETSGIRLENDVAIYLSQQFRANVRELEGSLIRLSAYAALHNVPITVDFAKEVLKDIVKDHHQPCSIEAVQKLVADYYQIKLSDMKSPRRMKHLAVPRQIAMYLCKKHIPKSSFPEIGRKFGGKDHTTVMHACRKIESVIQESGRMRDEVEFLEKSLVH